MELYWNLQKCISGFFRSAFPSQHWSSWRRLRLQKTFSRRLHQDRYIRITHTSSENVLKTSWRRLDQGKYILLGHTSSKRLQDVFKTSCKNVFKTSTRHLEDVLKMSWKHFCKTFLQDALLRRFQDVFKTSCKNVFKTSSRHLQNVFKTYHQVKLFLLTRFQDVFGTYSKHFWDVLQRRLSIEGFAYVTLLRNLRSVYKICKSDKSFSNFSFSLC